ncbi:hypothetical protein [Gracilibacillus timonensis]|uniref:hypothetical protein n=1 Tax=Gracilibacillus timonensis TaxID=1816696 RepID=UPI0008246F66|nr:hypothetical protein [Gracilibacillus timonensis]
MFFDGVMPLATELTIWATYIMALIWGYRGPRTYRRDRFFATQNKNLQEESEELITTGQLFYQGFQEVEDVRQLLPNQPLWKRHDIQFHYTSRFYIYTEDWSCHVSESVEESRKIVDYARMTKMLGAVSLEMAPNFFHRVLRLINWMLFFILFLTPFVLVITAVETRPDGLPNIGGPWEQLNDGGIVLFFYMVFRLGVETIQYLMQNRRSKKMISELQVFQSERTIQLIHQYLHRQFWGYFISYALVIMVFLALTAWSLE